MKLDLSRPGYYRVKRGQSLREIARVFLIPPRVLAAVNGLTAEPEEGQILSIPPSGGHLYVVRGGESKRLLCGSDEAFERKNFTSRLYPAQIVWI